MEAQRQGDCQSCREYHLKTAVEVGSKLNRSFWPHFQTELKWYIRLGCHWLDLGIAKSSHFLRLEPSSFYNSPMYVDTQIKLEIVDSFVEWFDAFLLWLEYHFRRIICHQNGIHYTDGLSTAEIFGGVYKSVFRLSLKSGLPRNFWKWFRLIGPSILGGSSTST